MSSNTLLAIGTSIAVVILVWVWGVLRQKALLSNTKTGLVVYHALGRGLLGALLAAALLGAWRTGDLVRSLLDVIEILLPLYVLHWVITKVKLYRVARNPMSK
jgi:hypothetical protein